MTNPQGTNAKGPAKGPLDGVKVIDLTEFIFGPYATQTLGDLGADVIKVENPSGDRQRHSGKYAEHEDMGCTYLALNRNKRSVGIDLKTEEGQKARRADPRCAGLYSQCARGCDGTVGLFL